ncbi:MAG: hypothetical protein K0B02_00015 [DPANN group archaeon]|nr:hypothetical protein [DPANN group archaeon]
MSLKLSSIINPTYTSNNRFQPGLDNYKKNRESDGLPVDSIIAGTNPKSITYVNAKCLKGKKYLNKRRLNIIESLEDCGSVYLDTSFNKLGQEDVSELKDLIYTVVRSDFNKNSKHRHSPMLYEFLDRDGKAIVAIVDSIFMQAPDTEHPGSPYTQNTAMQLVNGSTTKHLDEINRRIQVESGKTGMGHVYLLEIDQNKTFSPFTRFNEATKRQELIIQEFDTKGDGIHTELKYSFSGKAYTPELQKGWKFNMDAMLKADELKLDLTELKEYIKENSEISADNITPVIEQFENDLEKMKETGIAKIPESYTQLLNAKKQIKADVETNILNKEYEVDELLRIEELEEKKKQATSELNIKIGKLEIQEKLIDKYETLIEAIKELSEEDSNLKTIIDTYQELKDKTEHAEVIDSDLETIIENASRDTLNRSVEVDIYNTRKTLEIYSEDFDITSILENTGIISKIDNIEFKLDENSLESSIEAYELSKELTGKDLNKIALTVEIKKKSIPVAVCDETELLDDENDIDPVEEISDNDLKNLIIKDNAIGVAVDDETEVTDEGKTDSIIDIIK